MLLKLNNEKIAHNFFFLLVLLILPFLGWVYNNFSLVFIGVGLSLLLKVFLTCDIRLLFLDFMIPFVTTRENLKIETFPRLLIPLAFLIILATIIIILKNRLLLGKRKLNGGSMTRSFLIIGIIMMISPIVRHIFYNQPAFPEYPNGYNIMFGYVFGLAFLIFPILLLGISTFKTEDPTPIPNLMYQLALFLLAEVAYVIFIEGLKFHDALNYGGIGWGCKNLFMICFELTIPFTAYIFCKNFKRVDSLLLFLASLIVGLSSDSRSAQLALIAALPLLIWLLVPKVKYYKTTLCTIFVLSGVAMIVSLIYIPVLQESIKRLYESIFNNDNFSSIVSGRDVFWKWIADYVLDNPKHMLFGGSFCYCFELCQAYFKTDMINILLPHNLFMTFLSTAGIIGLVAILYHYVDLSYVVFKNKDKSRLLYFVFILIGFIHGIGDNTIFNIVFMVPYIFVLQDLDRIKKVQ